MNDSILYNDIIDDINIAVFITKQDGTIFYVNNFACTLSGYSKEELLTMHIHDISAPDFTELFIKNIKKLNRNESLIIEYALKKKDGENIPVDIILHSITHKDTGYIAIEVHDSTKHKNFETSLHESEALLKLITDNILDIVWIVNLKFEPLYVSKAVEHILGFGLEEYLSRRVVDRYPPEVLQEMYAQLLEELENEQKPDIDKNRTKIIEIQEFRKDGSLADLSVHVKFLRDENGKPNAIIGISRDISDKKKIETALKESEEKFRILAESTPMTIMMYQDDKWIYANPAARALLGYSEEELCAMNFWDVVHPDDKALIKERGSKRQKGENAEVGYEFRVIDKSGAIKWVLLYGATVTYKGKPAGLISVLDITERKKIEEERRQLQEQLLHSQKMESIGTLAGGVAHEFNNMLNIIAGHAELALLNIPDGNPARSDVEEIKRAAQRSAEITKKLLTFARKQEGNIALVNINTVIDSMIEMIKRLIGENIQLVWKPVNKELSVTIDDVSIDQILINLTVNARDAIIDQGIITISTNVVSIGDQVALQHDVLPGEYALVEVADNGIGMDKETMQLIFDPFFTTKEVGKGTGLGLSTVYGIVKNHGGFIDVHSEKGKGTTFKIYIPLFVENREYARYHDDAVQYLFRGTETILIVEDEVSILKMIKRMLEILGYTVLDAGDPFEALEIAKNYIGTIHLLITDVIMPKMNGVDLSKLVSAMHPKIRVLFTSGYSADVLLKHNINTSDINYLRKPVSFASLAATVRTVLDK